MPYTPEERAKVELQMFGMSKAQVVAEKPKFERPGMWAMSILSDAQETIARSGTDEARERARRYSRL